MSLVLTTDSVAPRQRVAFWQEMVCQSFVKAHCGSSIGESFRGRISTDDFGDAQVSRIDAGHQRIDRRRIDIAQCDRPRYYLCYQAAGRARFADRHSESFVDTGDLILLNNCEPYSVEYEDAVTEFVLQVPHALLHDRFRHPNQHVGRKLSGQHGVARLTADLLMSCARHADGLSESQRMLTSQMALNLVVELLLSESTADTAGLHRAVLKARIQQCVLSRIADPGLSLAGVAREMGLSTGYVCQLFRTDGDSFGRFLLRQRVEHCRRELSNPLLRNLRISEIALRGGFNDLSHFSRVFRDGVGASPTDYRNLAI